MLSHQVYDNLLQDIGTHIGTKKELTSEKTKLIEKSKRFLKKYHYSKGK